MFGLLVAGAIVWFTSSVISRRRRFLREFAALLTRPELEQGSALFALFRFSESLTGGLQGRTVVVVLKHRLQYRLGYLIVAMQAAAPASALQPLETVDDLTLKLENGWLKATWMPVGFFIFPGRFEEPKWRGVLRRLHELAGSLEGQRSSHP